MSRRRPAETDDSLELLLDTVCNMFGGIIFIAMLLATFAGVKGAGIAKLAGGSENVAEIVLLRSTLQSARERVARLEASARDANLAGAIVRGEDTERIAALADTVEADLTQARARLAESLAQLDRLEAKDRSVADTLRDAKTRAAALEVEAGDLAAALQREKEARTVAARLPVTRLTHKKPFHIVLTRARAFEIYTNDGARGYTTNDQDVAIAPKGAAALVTLKDTGGYPVTAALATHPRWANLLRRLDPKEHFLYIAVYPDSYVEFRVFKEVALRAGFEYDIVLMEEGHPLHLVPGDRFSTQ
jgi:hypothetical protein